MNESGVGLEPGPIWWLSVTLTIRLTELVKITIFNSIVL